MNTKEKFLIKKLSHARKSNDAIIVLIIPREYQEIFLNPKIFMSGKVNDKIKIQKENDQNLTKQNT
jgi:hypothetical protein